MTDTPALLAWSTWGTVIAVLATSLQAGRFLRQSPALWVDLSDMREDPQIVPASAGRHRRTTRTHPARAHHRHSEDSEWAESIAWYLLTIASYISVWVTAVDAARAGQPVAYWVAAGGTVTGVYAMAYAFSVNSYPEHATCSARSVYPTATVIIKAALHPARAATEVYGRMRRFVTAVARKSV
ncbi:hypothetical protein [Gordonia otitidis]|uniref:Uncharacterized protein n=1 Tax=Gordonia otitidis (strain DSM 44809 / CCUG 52243 / JCM 12355 / NBRC 100426 / IFM 10032) TaxID=1108044 RepID=H5TRR9_GORO1|nr:hypothetical protein [Gordonia otitidis]GAB36177.1 hypothetical protein GOOTI_202_00330 [Gordonia otitidis NBRC 100426]